MWVELLSVWIQGHTWAELGLNVRPRPTLSQGKEELVRRRCLLLCGRGRATGGKWTRRRSGRERHPSKGPREPGGTRFQALDSSANKSLRTQSQRQPRQWLEVASVLWGQ